MTTQVESATSSPTASATAFVTLRMSASFCSGPYSSRRTQMVTSTTIGSSPVDPVGWTLTRVGREIIRGSPDLSLPAAGAGFGRYDLAVADGRHAAIPLVGRESELSALRDAIEEATRGPCRVVVVAGEAGIGKSRLVQEAIAHAQRHGYRVLCGCAEELERTRPFGAIARALSSHVDSRSPALARVARLLMPAMGDEPGPVEPGVEHVRFLFVEELAAALASETQERPVVFAVEDLQWADPSTLLAVRTVSRRVADLPFVVLLTLRPSPRSGELSTLIDGLLRTGAAHLTLAPLGEQSVVELVRSVLGAVPGMKLRAQAARVGGNPLWVLELLRAMSQAGAVEIDDQGAELRQAELPASLRLTILRHLSSLSDDALHVLRVAAVLGATFDPQALATCLGRSAVEVLPALEEFMRAGIVGEAGDRLAFRHDLVWEVIYEDLPGPVRRGLHREAGRALARAGGSLSEVATHLGIGALPGDAEAVEWLQRAAREAAPRAPTVAAELLEQALRLVEPSDPRRDELTAERVAALVRSGRPAEAEALARERLAWAPNSDVAGRLRWGLAAALQVQGRLREALEETLKAVDARGLAAWRRARLLAEASQWSFYTGDPAKARALAEEAITAGEHHGDHVATCLGLTALSRIALDELEFDRAISLARQAFERARDTGAHRRSIDWIHPAFDLGGALLTADQLCEAEETLRLGRRFREELGSTWDLPLFTGALAHVHLTPVGGTTPLRRRRRRWPWRRKARPRGASSGPTPSWPMSLSIATSWTSPTKLSAPPIVSVVPPARRWRAMLLPGARRSFRRLRGMSSAPPGWRWRPGTARCPSRR